MSKFETLWKNHPTITDDDTPCSTNGTPNFKDQCAIRMGVCLARSGVVTRNIQGAEHCWHHDKSEGHIIRADELARGLSRSLIAGVQKKQVVKPKAFKDTLSGKTGIIFFQDYWRRKNETYANRSGDHIDLWNGSRLTDWTTWCRIQLGLSLEGYWSDFTGSKEIWFFPVL